MQDFQDDPTFLSARREAGLILLMWFLCMVWSIGWSYAMGYTEHPQKPGTVSALLPDLSHLDHEPVEPATPLGLGIPRWAFWGIALPWVVAGIASILFATFVLRDDPESLRTEEGPMGEV